MDSQQLEPLGTIAARLAFFMGVTLRPDEEPDEKRSSAARARLAALGLASSAQLLDFVCQVSPAGPRTRRDGLRSLTVRHKLVHCSLERSIAAGRRSGARSCPAQPQLRAKRLRRLSVRPRRAGGLAAGGGDP